jgi:arylsulfatase A-like enzyme/Flp pilus assembly protein TadD
VLQSDKVLRFVFLALSVCAQAATPVILISVDTLRADHLSCYQPGTRLTPHIDSLAKNGTLFSQVSSPYPLTLPAHVALFASTYPFTTGVEDNGVPFNSSPATLATVLKSAGYRTGAFVGSFILDRRFGLARGFDAYDGPLDLHNKPGNVAIERKRPGAQVAEAAKRWVEQNKDAPFFLFLHLYDLHLPYDLPQGYSGELAYVDRVLGDFFAFLQQRGLMEKSLVAFTSDHGEGLGDHGERTHGYFIYQSTLHVPLIVHWPAASRRIPQDRVEEPAGLLDVTPTILESLGIRAPAGMKGRSLIGPGGEREIYSESIYARNHFGCASLRSVRAGRYKYIEAPKPELYDLASDPKELHNLYEQQRSKAAQLSGRIAAIRASSPTAAPAKPTAENAAALRSLGYLGGPASTGREPRVDPKDRIADFQRYFDAVFLATEGRLAESTPVLENLRDKLPDIAEIRISLGINLKRLGRYPEATREFKRATGHAPSDAQAYYELGSCYFQQRETQQAITAFKAALAIEPWYTLADEALAEIYVQKQDFTQARAHLNHLLSIDPRSYVANYNLGVMAAMEKNWGEAEQRVLAAIEADPNSAAAHKTLGGIYMARGDSERARQQFEKAARLDPASR